MVMEISVMIIEEGKMVLGITIKKTTLTIIEQLKTTINDTPLETIVTTKVAQ